MSKGKKWTTLLCVLVFVSVALTGGASGQPLSGTYTIGGTTPSYATFTAATADLISKGVNGPVVFNARAGTYTEQINLTAIGGSSASNTITFQSESGTASDVTLQFAATASNANYVIGLTGASHVRIKNLTLASSGVGTSYRNVIRIDGTTTSVSDVVINGNSFDGYNGSSASSDLSLIYLVVNSNITNLSILNNTFVHGAYAIYLYGNGSTPGSGTIVKGNTTGSAYGGMYLLNQNAPVVDSNTVSATTDGINLNSCSDVGGTSQLLVQRNRVTVLGSAYGIQVNSSSGNSTYSGLVANNFVAATGTNPYGMQVANSSYINVYYNSINVTGTGASSIGFYQTGGTGVKVENNVFMNAGGGYACYVGSASAIALSDHNDFYSTGGTWLAYWGGTYAADLAALQAASSQDANSVSANPLYTSTTDLHVNSPWLDGKGVVVAGVTTDISGSARSGSTPDIGAVEFTSSLTKVAGGTYTIGGASPSYATFTAAVADLNTRGITGAVTFNVRAGSYNEQLSLAPVAGSTPSNTVTFQSENGVASGVTLFYAQSQSVAAQNYVFLLNSAEHVRVKNMTLVSDGVGTSYRNVLVLNGNVNDLTVQGDSLHGYTGTNTGNQALSLLYATSVQMSAITVTNNTFAGGSYGVSLYASNTGGAPGTVVKGNVFSNPAGYGGLALTSHAAPVVDSNTVNALSDGINLNTCGNATGVQQLSVQRNRVTVTGNAYGIQINNSTGNTTYSGLVANNVVAATGANPYGVQVANSSYINVYYNSINVTGSGTSGIALYQTGGTGVKVENNILMNAVGGWAYYVGTASAIALSDHNDVYTIGGTWLAYWGGTYAADLAAMQAASSQDANSVSANPLFTSATDLHVNSPWLDGKAAVLAAVTNDYFGAARNGTTPDIGAAEFTSSLTKLAGGTYTIGGTSPSYATFTAAVIDLNTRGITGAVTFNARAGSYNEQVSLAPVAGSSPTNTVTFQSEAGVASGVTLHFSQSQSDATANYVLLLNSAEHVRVKNLTLVSDAVGTSYRNVLVLNGNVSDLIVQGDSLRGYTGTNNGSQSLALMYSPSMQLGALTITNNIFSGGSYGVALSAANTGGAPGTVVRGNIFSNAGGYGGVALTSHAAPVVDSNTVSALNDGINLNSCGNAAGTQQLSVQRNRVTVLGSAYGIQVNSSSGNSTYSGLVANNFVAATGTNPYGVQVANSSYINVYDNSINVTGPGTSSIGLYQTGGTGVKVENNIFMNAGGGYACYVGTASAIALSDHNDFYSTGGTWLAYWGGTYAADLAALQAASSQDANSVSANPLFTSATDFHVNSPWLDGKAAVLAAVTTDYFGAARNGTTPDIGAVEFTSSLTKLPGGIYTIGGTSPSYATFGLAVTDLNTRGIAGAVTFNARAGSYNEQLNLAPVAGSSPVNTVTFQSESGVASGVTVHYSQSQSDATGNYVFQLNSASHVRVRNLTLMSDGVGTSYRNVLALNGNVSDLIVQGDSLRGYTGTNNGGQSLALLFASSTQLTNVTVANNRFGGGSYGVLLSAANSGGAIGTTVSGNVFSNSTGYGGIYLNAHQAPVVDSNTVSVLTDGINLGSCGNVAGIAQLLVQRNRVVLNGSGYGMQINSSSGNNSYSGLVANNFVTATGSNPYGIQAANSSYLNIFNNSINVTGTGTSGIALYQSGGTGMKIENNILSNSGGGYAYYVGTPGGLAVSDYNTLYSSGTNLAYWSGNQTTIAALQSASSTNANAFAYLANFVSPTDLHLTGSSLGSRWLLGTPVAEVTKDIDGNARNATKPYRGANEGSVLLSVGENGNLTKNGLESAPHEYQLLQNYPNPFNPTTEVKFAVASTGRTTIDLFNILGEHVSTLFDDMTQAGQYYRVAVNGNALASGTYFYVIKSGTYTSAKKMLLLK